MPLELTERVIRRHVKLMQKTVETIGHIVHNTPTAALNTFTDGADGWTVGEVVGHLLDADRIFFERAQKIVNEDKPALVVFDHERLVKENDYRHRDPRETYAALLESRLAFIEWLKARTPEEWTRTGIHPESGEIELIDGLMQVGHHDADHLEQLTRILREQYQG